MNKSLLKCSRLLLTIKMYFHVVVRLICMAHLAIHDHVIAIQFYEVGLTIYVMTTPIITSHYILFLQH